MQSFACPENGWIDNVPLAVGEGPGRFAWLATDLADLRRPADQQVWVNLAEFRSLVIEPPGGDPRRTVAVTHGALTWTGHLVVESFDIRERGPAEIVGVLEVSLPMGQLEMEVVP